MISYAALGLTLVVTFFLTGCGIVVTDEAPSDVLQISAPPLVEVDPVVDAVAPASIRTLSAGRARKLARRAALQVAVPACDEEPKGRGFAVDAHTLIAHRDVIEGGGWARVWAANRRTTTVGAASARRVGDLVVARVARRLPRRLPSAKATSGTSVVVVAERDGKLRMLPGVVVDKVSGEPYGVRTPVLRLTSAVREGDSGPLLDAKGRVVGALFAFDPQTTFGLAIPVAALRARASAVGFETLDACD